MLYIQMPTEVILEVDVECYYKFVFKNQTSILLSEPRRCIFMAHCIVS